MTSRRLRHRWSRILGAVALFGLTGLIPAAPAVAASTGPAAQTASSAVSVTRTVTRVSLDPAQVNNTTPDPAQATVVDSNTVTVKVSQTQALRGLQQIDVAWSGAHPTSYVENNFNSAAADEQEYPMVLLECRVVDPNDPPAQQHTDPSTCWTHGVEERYLPTNNGSSFPAWRLDAYATAAQRDAVVGQPNPIPESNRVSCPLSSYGAHWQPFVAADGTSYYWGSNGCAGLPPEDSVLDVTSGMPSNSTFAATGADGTGSVKFDVWTATENSSLNCSSTVPCDLEVIPIMGISCDPLGVSTASAGLPAADVPTGGIQTASATSCEKDNAYAAGAPADSGAPNRTVTGELWWSASNWRNRITIPLGIAPTSENCSVVGVGTPVQIYSSELMDNAMQQWSPAFCTNPKLFNLTAVDSPEPLSRTLLASGSVNAAIGGPAPPGELGDQVVQAPVAVTGFSVSYLADGTNGAQVTTLRMTPRLLAKLLTESYAYSSNVAGSYPHDALAKNPWSITSDPEFQALNPGVTTSVSGGADLIFLSGGSDVTYAVTSYIEADPEARAWLDGKPDQWGMVVNPSYKGIQLPVSTWPLLDTWSPDYSTMFPGQADIAACAANDSVPYMQLIASPVTSLLTAAQDIQFGTMNSKTGCSYNASNPILSQWEGSGSSPYGSRFVIGITSLGQAERYGLETASLQSDSVTLDASSTGGTARSFVAPTTASMRAAVGALTPDSSGANWSVDYTKLRSLPTAYPGTMLMEADIPTTGLDPGLGADYAQFLTFAAGAGQQTGYGNGQLPPPPAYLPMTAANGLGAEAAYTVRVASYVKAQQGIPIPNPPTSSTSPTAGASTPSIPLSSSGTKTSLTGLAGAGAPTSGQQPVSLLKAPSSASLSPPSTASRSARSPRAGAGSRSTPGTTARATGTLPISLAAKHDSTLGAADGLAGVLLPVLLIGGLAAGLVAALMYFRPDDLTRVGTLAARAGRTTLRTVRR